MSFEVRVHQGRTFDPGVVASDPVVLWSRFRLMLAATARLDDGAHNGQAEPAGGSLTGVAPRPEHLGDQCPVGLRHPSAGICHLEPDLVAIGVGADRNPIPRAGELHRVLDEAIQRGLQPFRVAQDHPDLHVGGPDPIGGDRPTRVHRRDQIGQVEWDARAGDSTRTSVSNMVANDEALSNSLSTTIASAAVNGSSVRDRMRSVNPRAIVRRVRTSRRAGRCRPTTPSPVDRTNRRQRIRARTGNQIATAMIAIPSGTCTAVSVSLPDSRMRPPR